MPSRPPADGPSAVGPDRIASIAARLGEPPAASRGIGTWTAMIGGLLIVLAGLLLLPLVPRMSGLLRPASRPASSESDLPDGAFRSGGPSAEPAAAGGGGTPEPPESQAATSEPAAADVRPPVAAV